MKKITLFLFSAMAISTASFAQTSTKKTPATKVTKPATAKPQVAADALKFENSNKEEEFAVDGKDVLISGNNNKITITGNVGKILITGKDNDITIVAVNEIVITGNGNFVSWEKTNTSSAKPIIQDKGGYNNVEKRSGNAQTKEEN
jgi:hypothetical protein